MTTILVVDDEPEIRQVVRAYLEREGFAVLTAVDGDEALRLVRTESPVQSSWISCSRRSAG